MNETIAIISLLLILNFFLSSLKSNKKNKRNYRKKQTKSAEKQKLVILGSIVAFFLLIKFPKTIFLFIIILTIIGIYFFLKEINVLSIFKKESLQETLKRYDENEEKRKKTAYKNKPNPYLNTKQQTKNYSKKAKKRAGDNYEKEVGKYYKNLGYEITYNGLEKGYYDEGIDLIAKNENRTLLIQCKNWQNSIITIKEIYKFLDNSNKFISKKNFKTPIIEKIFVVSKKRKNIEIEEFIERNKNLFEYKEIPYADII